jgi:hypothetical protein
MKALVAFPSVSKNELRTMRRQHASDSPHLLGAGKPSTSLPREAPRLCRGGSRSLTFQEVAHRRKRSTRGATTHAEEILRWTTQQPKPDKSQGANVVYRSHLSTSDALEDIGPSPSVMEFVQWAWSIKAALSGPIPKAPGFAGGYLPWTRSA